MRKAVYVGLLVVVAAAVVFVFSNRKSRLIIPAKQNPANAELTDLIKVYNPQPNQEIISPLSISGEARGNWYFEASFPVIVVDWDGRIIGEGHATAKPAEGKDWMTTEFVPFEGAIGFARPECSPEAEYCKKGAVIFKNDNPSGLPANDRAVEIPIIF